MKKKATASEIFREVEGFTRLVDLRCLTKKEQDFLLDATSRVRKKEGGYDLSPLTTNEKIEFLRIIQKVKGIGDE